MYARPATPPPGQVGIKEQEEREKALVEALEAAIEPIGNLVHDSVPISDDEVRRRGRRCCCCVMFWC